MLLCLGAVHGFGQGSGLPLGSTNYHIVDRLEIKSGQVAPFHSSLKTFIRGKVAGLALQLDTSTWLTKLDKADISRILLDNNEWIAPNPLEQTIGERRKEQYVQIGADSLGPIYRKRQHSYIAACLASDKYERCKKPILRYFYPTPANWLELNKPNFQLRLNPMLNFGVSKPNAGEPLFINQRGVEVRGGIDDRVYFYSQIAETQARFADYVNDYIGKNIALPGNGYFKGFNSTTFNSEGSYDYLNAQGHIGFKATPSIGLEFGHGRHFIGNGYRSLLLSDFSQNYLYLKANWDFWRIHYQNLFTEFAATSSNANPGDTNLPRKYMAAHYLGFEVSKNFTFGLYEATIFNRDSSSENGYELQYLNPVIFYRAVEHFVDSEDNVLIGLDFKWNIFRRARLYGQFILDEFKLSEIRARNGWWANKYGLQLGGQYIDMFGIDHLDMRVEYNSVRPYTYTHSGTWGASYSHYNQALAHPLGANFRERLGTLRYQPLKSLTLEARYIMAVYGEDLPGENWGKNILLDNTTFEQTYGNKIGQGQRTATHLWGLDLSYEIWHNLNIDLHYLLRKSQIEKPATGATDSFFGFGIRWNTAKVKMDF